MPRAGLTPEAVLDHASALVDEGGPEALTLARTAARAGVATPSLYAHVGSLAELRSLLAARILGELADRAAAAVLGRSGDDAVRAFLDAYRAYVREHPRRYAALVQRPDPALAEPGQRLLDIVYAALRGHGLDGSDAVHAARMLRSAAHGFCTLEAAGGFGLPEDLDESYRRLVDTLLRGLR